MGYGEFGGGGSVKWVFDVDDAPVGGVRPGERALEKKRVSASGRDDQTPPSFTVTIAYNDQAKANAAWAALRNALPPAGNTSTTQVVVTIPFDDHGNHKVKVNWP
jgi:hypothetical protein